ncbi:MAG: hypothetical protein G01um10148_935 [Parcubacteria group bacterium Gr01-1014_8]|nr:MAG: hypothetical protein G01um10148_935 [Parcubacteria group bacterium Gr01-1014_8]
MCDLIRSESEKIHDERAKYLYIVRSLFEIGDERGRTLSNEELAILDKSIRGERFTKEEEDVLSKNEAEYMSDAFARTNTI